MIVQTAVFDESFVNKARAINAENRLDTARSNVRQHLLDTVAMLEQSREWKRISIRGIAGSSSGFVRQDDQFVFKQSLKKHPNIIQVLGQGRTSIPKYKYVDEDEKKEMGFDAVQFRHISATRLEDIKKAFSAFEPQNDIADILGVLEYLFESEADRNWVIPEPFKVLRLYGIGIKVFCSVISELRKVGILYDTLINRGEDEQPVPTVKIAFTENEKNIVEQEKDIAIIGPENPEPVQKRLAVESRLQDELNEISLLDAVNENKSATVTAAEAEKAGTEMGIIASEEHATGTSIEDNPLDCGTFVELGTRLTTLLDDAVKKIAEKQYGRQVDVLISELDTFRKQSEKDNETIRVLQKKIADMELINGKRREFIQEKTNDLIGRMTMLACSFSSQPHHAYDNDQLGNDFRAKIFNLLSGFSQEVNSFGLKDIVPPDLKG